ncbi:MAG: DUF1801 domain-containing protein [Bacteroidota bacterium]
MDNVEEFIDGYEGDQKKVLQFFHHWFSRELGLTDKLRFNIPVYFRHNRICYLKPTRHKTIELAFLRGNELSNIQGLLFSRNRKQVAGIEFRSVADIPREVLDNIMQEALLLDETVPYKSKRSKSK